MIYISREFTNPMPRKKPTKSSFIVIDVVDDAQQTLKPFDKFLQKELKVLGRGNRSDAIAIAELISALQYIRQDTKRLKVKYLNKNELRHPKIINALENLGIFKSALTTEELTKFKRTGALPINRTREIKNAYSYFMKKAVSYL